MADGAPAHTAGDVSEAAAAAEQILPALETWLAARGLPAPPWRPDPAWGALEPPALALDPRAMATLSAFAQLRAMALALGVDPLVPARAGGFVRLVATLNARLAALAPVLAPAGESRAWQGLARTLNAARQVDSALAFGVFGGISGAVLGAQEEKSGGAGGAESTPLAPWRPFLGRMRALLPIIAVAGQLGLDLSGDFAAELAAMVRVMRRIVPPPLVATPLMLKLTTGLAAVALLRETLGLDPLRAGLPAVRDMVARRAAQTTQKFHAATGFGAALRADALVALLPRTEYCPSLMVTPAVVAAAMSINATTLAAITWKVPATADIPVLAIGLPALAFATQLSAALGTPAVQPAPCDGSCDAARVLRAAGG